MSNMSYCRFENTLNDLSDCQYALENLARGEGEDKLSANELEAAQLLVGKCVKILELVAEFHAIPVSELIERTDRDSLIASLNANARRNEEAEEEDIADASERRLRMMERGF